MTARGRRLPECWPGESGFTLVQYVGKAPDARPWLGAETNVTYAFGPGDVRWVDARDAVRWLTPLRGDGKAFVEVAD